MKYKYEVSISFAGEDRDFAEAIAKGLRDAGVNVFYDNFYAADLWGKDLSVELRKVYHSESRFCIMILTQDYVKKMWTSFERQQAIERLIQEMGSDYVLPVKVDGYPGEVEGLSNNIGYLSVRSNNPEVVVDAFLEKIGAKGGDSPRATQASSGKSGIPKLKRDFTDKEKNQFLKESFETIISSLEDLTVSTEKENPQFEHEMERITSRKALFTLYKRGEQITQFKVWRGEPFGGDSICFFHGNRIDVETDSMNESFSLQEDQGALKLRTLGLASFGAESEKLMSPAEAAEYLWGIVCRNLS